MLDFTAVGFGILLTGLVAAVAAVTAHDLGDHCDDAVEWHRDAVIHATTPEEAVWHDAKARAYKQAPRDACEEWKAHREPGVTP